MFSSERGRNVIGFFYPTHCIYTYEHISTQVSVKGAARAPLPAQAMGRSPARSVSSTRRKGSKSPGLGTVPAESARSKSRSKSSKRSRQGETQTEPDSRAERPVAEKDADSRARDGVEERGERRDDGKGEGKDGKTEQGKGGKNMCAFHREGRCKFGERCRFSHGKEDSDERKEDKRGKGKEEWKRGRVVKWQEEFGKGKIRGEEDRDDWFVTRGAIRRKTLRENPWLEVGEEVLWKRYMNMWASTKIGDLVRCRDLPVVGLTTPEIYRDDAFNRLKSRRQLEKEEKEGEHETRRKGWGKERVEKGGKKGREGNTKGDYWKGGGRDDRRERYPGRWPGGKGKEDRREPSPDIDWKTQFYRQKETEKRRREEGKKDMERMIREGIERERKRIW